MLEIACFNEESATRAARAGADRIELCFDYAAGGVTPSLDVLRRIRASTTIPIHVMIRPRGGNFQYSDQEIQKMRSDIQAFKELANGFVFGILDHENRVDVPANRALVQLAAPRACTFHRAFDCVPDLFEAAEQVIECGFAAILTSGGAENAESGWRAVMGLQREFGARIQFILGGGVRKENIAWLREGTGVECLHSAAITANGEEVDEGEVRGMQEALRASRAIVLTMSRDMFPL